MMKLLIVFDDVYGIISSITNLMINTLRKESIQCMAKPTNKVTEKDIVSADIVIIGAPTTQFGPSKNISEFFIRFARVLRHKYCTSFTAVVKGFLPGMNRSANKKIIRYLHKLSCMVMQNPVDFYLQSDKGPLFDSERERIIQFAKYAWMF